MASMRAVVGLLLVKDRIQQHYAEVAHLDRRLTDFKRKHGYCGGRPFCMVVTGADQHSCKDCLKANANPKYKKRVSEYGKMRMKEKQQAERKSGARLKKKAA